MPGHRRSIRPAQGEHPRLAGRRPSLLRGQPHTHQPGFLDEVPAGGFRHQRLGEAGRYPQGQVPHKPAGPLQFRGDLPGRQAGQRRDHSERLIGHPGGLSWAYKHRAGSIFTQRSFPVRPQRSIARPHRSHRQHRLALCQLRRVHLLQGKRDKPRCTQHRREDSRRSGKAPPPRAPGYRVPGDDGHRFLLRRPEELQQRVQADANAQGETDGPVHEPFEQQQKHRRPRRREQAVGGRRLLQRLRTPGEGRERIQAQTPTGLAPEGVPRDSARLPSQEGFRRAEQVPGRLPFGQGFRRQGHPHHPCRIIG